MSWLWHFYSYSQPAFDAYLGGGRAGAVEEVVDAVAWDGWAWADPVVIRRLAERVAHRGISYAGLTRHEAECLDELIPALFAPEGLAAQWDVVPESPDGLHPSVVQEMMRRAAGAALLPILLSGRRYGAVEPCACGYCLLSSSEAEQMAAEAERTLASTRAWSGAWVPGVVRDCLLDPLRSAFAKGRTLIGKLG